MWWSAGCNPGGACTPGHGLINDTWALILGGLLLGFVALFWWGAKRKK